MGVRQKKKRAADSKLSTIDKSEGQRQQILMKTCGKIVTEEKISPSGKIPISLQFSILLGRFACIFIQRLFRTSGSGGRLQTGWMLVGRGRMTVEDAWMRGKNGFVKN